MKMDKRSRNDPPGFTLIEVLVVLGILGILAGLLFPVLATSREVARKTTCVANLRQIGLAFRMYGADYDGFFPNNGDPYLWMGRRWRWPLQPYLALTAERDPQEPTNPNRSIRYRPGILVCPSDATAPQQWDSTSYGYSCAFYHTPAQINAMTQDDLWRWNRFPCVSQSEAAVLFPAQKGLVAEWLTNHDTVAVGWWDWRGARTYLFVDGHVKYLRATQIRPAGDGFPDLNLTADGIAGRDID